MLPNVLRARNMLRVSLMTYGFEGITVVGGTSRRLWGGALALHHSEAVLLELLLRGVWLAKSAVADCSATKPRHTLLRFSLQQHHFSSQWRLEYDGWQTPGNVLARAASQLQSGSTRDRRTCLFLVNRLRKPNYYTPNSVFLSDPFICQLNECDSGLVRGTTEAGQKVSLVSYGKQPLFPRPTGCHVVICC